MLTKLLKAKIHRATVTFTDVDYHGSITIDPLLLEASGMLVNEAVLIADCDNGNRFETYIIPGEPGSGVIGINGAAARLTAVGHKVIILTFGQFEPEEVAEHRSRVVLVDARNRITEVIEHATTTYAPVATG
jgi:aspartate 1-decarboxylase